MWIRRVLVVVIVASVVGVGVLLTLQRQKQDNQHSIPDISTNLRKEETSSEPAPSNGGAPTTESEPVAQVSDELDDSFDSKFLAFSHYLTTRRSLYPASPYDVYADHIESASAGNATSMYWVSEALYECAQTARDEYQLLEDIAGNRRLDQLWDEYIELMNRCEKLFNEFPTGDLWEPSRDWLKKAAEAGHHTSRAFLIFDNIKTGDAYLEARTVIHSAVSTDGYPAWYLAERYVKTWIRDNMDRAEHAVLQKNAWRHAGCKAHPACNEETNLEYTELNHPSWEVDEILRLVAQIENGEYPPLPK